MPRTTIETLTRTQTLRTQDMQQVTGGGWLRDALCDLAEGATGTGWGGFDAYRTGGAFDQLADAIGGNG